MTHYCHKRVLLLDVALRNALALVLLSALCGLGSAAHADERTSASPAQESSAIENPGVAVELDGRPILKVYSSIGSFTPKDRAEAIENRLVAFAKKKEVGVETVRAVDHGTWTEILAGNDRIMGITQADATAAEVGRAEMATEYTEIIRLMVKQYREEHTVSGLLWGVLYATAAAISCAAVLVMMFWVRRRVRFFLGLRLTRTAAAKPPDALGAILANYVGQPLLFIGSVGFWIAVLGLLQAFLVVTLRAFPSTRYSSYQITSWAASQFAGFGKAVLSYIPNLIFLAFVCVATASLIKLNHFLFSEIRDERLTITGFYSDWAEPTAKLIRAFILIAAVIVAFPYLPGSESPAFKGISVFLGLLLSLGSTSAVAHAVAGTILTYMRAFQIGDFVRIGNDMGEVLEKTLLVTRMRTQKNEVITIPNGTVLGGVVMNYSAEGRKRGVIFHTVVTIGYSAPWRQVHALLISAALETQDILQDPAPFVLQTALNDFYVSYELNAYTAKPMNMLHIYSMLHQNIQDKFNQAGVEINSPHYTSLRDGNETTIPHDYLAKDYEHPVFEFQHKKRAGSAVLTSHQVPTANKQL